MTVKDFLTGTTGIGATSTGAYISVLPQVEQWLRITSLVIGCIVGALTLALLVRRLRSKDTRVYTTDEIETEI